MLLTLDNGMRQVMTRFLANDQTLAKAQYPPLIFLHCHKRATPPPSPPSSPSQLHSHASLLDTTAACCSQPTRASSVLHSFRSEMKLPHKTSLLLHTPTNANAYIDTYMDIYIPGREGARITHTYTVCALDPPMPFFFDVYSLSGSDATAPAQTADPRRTRASTIQLPSGVPFGSSARKPSLL